MQSEDNSEQEWRQQHSRWNKANLHTEGAIYVPSESYLYVRHDHPAITLVKSNANMLLCEEMPKLIDGQFYKVSRRLFKECCKTIRAHVLTDMGEQ